MTEFENVEAMELSMDEMNEISGGYKPMAEKKGFKQIKIQKGDTLIKIANRYHCTVNDLMKWNPQITNKSLIYAGAYLYIKA